MSFANPDGTFFKETGSVPALVVAPATGATVTLPAGTSRLYINTALLAALTIKLPPTISAGQEVRIVAKTGVTALTLQDRAGVAVTGAVTTLAAGVTATVVALALTPGTALVWTRW